MRSRPRPLASIAARNVREKSSRPSLELPEPVMTRADKSAMLDLHAMRSYVGLILRSRTSRPLGKHSASQLFRQRSSQGSAAAYAITTPSPLIKPYAVTPLMIHSSTPSTTSAAATPIFPADTGLRSGPELMP